MRLTLQALAEIEAAFGASDLQALGERLSGGKLAARDLVVLLGATMRGGGAQLADTAIAMKIDASDISRAVAALGEVFRIAFSGDPVSPEPDASRHPRMPQDG